MSKVKAEYIWIDGYEPTANLRSKTKIVDGPVEGLEQLPDWGFDGSSTLQADGNDSDCALKPVYFVPDPIRGGDDILVMCEVLNADGTTHKSNNRANCVEVSEKYKSEIPWFGIEQEYTFYDGSEPLGFPSEGYPAPQGEYYCGVGAGNVVGREISDAHLEACLDLGITLTGTNAEVALGQWEYQCFGKGIKAADDLWVSRYLLYKIAEEYGVGVNIHPKPKTGDWNGSGMHCNFSNEEMRTAGSEELFSSICDKLGEVHAEGIASYGSDNDMRLTGLHETQSIDKFSYGVSDRGASIRIPVYTVEHDWNGYLEDRRPASNADPYKILAHIVGTLTK